MFFQRIFTPGLAINSYLLGDEKSKRCVVIDPPRHVIPFIIQAQNADLEITYILETHVHADFVSGAKELKHQLNEKPLIYSSGMGGKEWVPHYTDVKVEKGTQIKLGDLRLEAVHTPGHTPEHIIWICYDESRSSTTPWFVFTGDSLFVGSIGRPDLLGKKEMEVLAPQLYNTIFDVFAPFSDFVEIFPAHGAGSLCGKTVNSRGESTLGYERLFNPYLKKAPLDRWINNVLKELPPAPHYFQHLKKVNVQGPPLLSSLTTKIWNKEEAPNLKDLFLLDVRRQEPFAASHIKGSINIPFSHTFCQWAGWIVPVDRCIGLVVENQHFYAEVVDQLRLMGFDQEIRVIEWGVNQQDFIAELSSFPFMEIDELAKRKGEPDSPYVLDVRTLEEWNAGHLPEAHHLELTKLEENLNLLPNNRLIALLCRSGQRASTAASILQKQGFSSVVNIRGGMQGWKPVRMP